MLRRRLWLLALLSALFLGVAAPAATADAQEPVEVCDGVYVVVDFTEIGGAVEAGCADGDPTTGREALETAGFTPTDDASGLICAIDSEPADPCGAFEGSFWAYWQLVDGEWVQSQVGADQADPTPGVTEGWVYNDGSAPPAFDAADVPPTAAAEETSSAATEETTTVPGSASGDLLVGRVVGVGIALVVAIVVVVLALRARRRRRS